MRKTWSEIAGMTLVLICLALSAHTSEAADYYVDYASGADSNNGLGTNNAWQHCPGDPAASGGPASATLSPGDTVHFKGGVKYVLTGTGGIGLNWSGTTNNYITYDGNSAGTWGSGKANIRASYDTNGVELNGAINIFQGNQNLVGLGFQNFDLGPAGGSLTLPVDAGSPVPAVYGGGIVNNLRFDYVRITNCCFHNIGYSFNQQPMSADSINGVGIYSVGFSHFCVSNCTFTSVAHAIDMQVSGNCSAVWIKNCTFMDRIVWCVDFAQVANGAALDDIYISGNTFTNYSRAFCPGSTTNNWSGYGGWPHCDGIFIRGNAGGLTTFTDGTNINIFNNYFISTFSDGQGGTSEIFMLGSENANIFNNVFNNCKDTTGTINMGYKYYPWPTLVRIYNNTFYYYKVPQIEFGQYWAPVGTNVEFDCENNIFYDQASTGYDVVDNQAVYGDYFTNHAAFNNIYFDYNDYRTLNTKSVVMLFPLYGGHMSIASAATTGADSSVTNIFGWETHGKMSSPPLAVLSGASATSLSSFQVLLTNTPSYLAGTNLTSKGLTNLNSDIMGVPRTTNIWTLGAFQAAAGPTYQYYLIQTNTYVTNQITDGKYSTNAVTEDIYKTNQVVDNHYVTNLVNLTKGTTNVLSGDVYVTNPLPASFVYLTNQSAVVDIFATNQTQFTQVVSNLFFTNQVASNIYSAQQYLTTVYFTNYYTAATYTTNIFPSTVYLTIQYYTNVVTGTAGPTNSGTGGNTNQIAGNAATNAPSAPGTVTIVTTTTSP